MKRWSLFAAVATIGLAAAIYVWVAGKQGPPVKSEGAPCSAMISGAAGSQRSQAAAPGLAVSRKAVAPVQLVIDSSPSAAESKGRNLFDDRPLALPEVPASSDAARHLETQATQARALNPRLERQLDLLRARLGSASPEQRKRLEVSIQVLERNLEHRREREAFVLPPSVGDGGQKRGQ